ncbi:MAG: hypothetical protein IKF22_11790 [Lachnospiraceae bacterium]|jgi:hypothetical protein|nr:hypothetical protein [Lachnospiraceae bacterium]
MRNKICDLIVITCFIAMLALPLAFSDKTGGKLQADENRWKAKAPSTLVPHKGLTKEIENWIDDNCGGREIAKSFYNTLNYGYLNEFRSDSAIVMNDWYYSLDSEDLTLNNLQHKDVMTNDEVEIFISRMQDINNYFKEQGIKFGMSVFPYKVDVYPDNLKGYVTQVRPNSEINLMQTIAINYPELNMNVVNKELKEAAAAGKLVCYRSFDGGHWNAQGVRYGYASLMKQISGLLPKEDIRILTDEDFNMQILERTNTVLGQKFSEEDVSYSVKEPTAVQHQEWFDMIDYHANDPWRSYRYYETGDSSKPDILIVGDSYIWMQMFPWIAESFDRSVFIHQFDEDNIQRIIDRVHPDIVIFAGLTTTVEDLVHYSSLTTERTMWGNMFF